MNDTRLRDVVDTDLFDYGPERSRLLVRLWRKLAGGEPLAAPDIRAASDAAGIGPADADAFLHSVSERDGDGRIVGLLGLSLNDHPHRFIVGGRTFTTWCAIDTLFLPAMLGTEATVESRSPFSGRDVRVTVGPGGVHEVDPPGSVVSVPIVDPDEVDTSSTEGIWSAFCHRIYFFPDDEEAGQWVEGRGRMEIVPVSAAHTYAMETWSKVLPHVQALDAER